MAEPMEQTHHLETSCSLSGGTGGDSTEHLPAGDRARPENGARGRQRAHKQQRRRRQRTGSCGGNDADKLWQMKGAQSGGCPALAAGSERTKCPIAAQPAAGGGGGGGGGGDNVSLGENGEDGQLGETPDRMQESALVDSDTGLDARLGKKRHRRRTTRKRRTWKPYYKLSWEERKALEERETARASRMREEMFAKGLPVAPYNTTQFLMDEHDREEPDLHTGARRPVGVGCRAEDPGSEDDAFDNNNNDDEEDDEDGGDGSGGGGGSDGIGRPGNAGGEFLQRDFSETYEMFHVESLQNLSKQELVLEYLELEKRLSRLEDENNRLRRAAEPGAPAAAAAEGPLVRLGELERELERLRAQNTELLLQNRPSED